MKYMITALQPVKTVIEFVGSRAELERYVFELLKRDRPHATLTSVVPMQEQEVSSAVCETGSPPSAA